VRRLGWCGGTAACSDAPFYPTVVNHALWPQFCEIRPIQRGSNCLNCHGRGQVPESMQPATGLPAISPNFRRGRTAGSVWDRLHLHL
jgi:hypothetical protein